jgi:hypothetical protein
MTRHNAATTKRQETNLRLAALGDSVRHRDAACCRRRGLIALIVLCCDPPAIALTAATSGRRSITPEITFGPQDLRKLSCPEDRGSQELRATTGRGSRRPASAPEALPPSAGVGANERPARVVFIWVPYIARRSRLRPAGERSSFASSVPSLSGFAALKRVSTSAIYSSRLRVRS